MADAADLLTQLTTALAAVSTPFVVFDAGTLTTQRVARSEYKALTRIASGETVDIGSNLTRDIADVEVELLHRAAGSTPAQLGTAESALAVLVVEVARVSFWTALVSVRSTPTPEITINSDVERIGETIRYIVRASCALEA